MPAPARRRWPLRLLRWVAIGAVWAVVAAALLLIWFARDLPRPEAALDAARRPGLTLQDRNGKVFATFGDVVGEPLRLTDVPRCLPAAAVAVEDRRFWSHPGIDVVGIGRAAWVNLRARRLVQGGSTITQQVAKNLFLSNERTFRRKVQELMLTVWLERTFTKAEILEIWLNRVYLGSGAWGVDAGARMYFGVSARKLTLAQCAVLAGLPRAPSRINPRADPKAAAARGRDVLSAMADTGAITLAQAAAAGSGTRAQPCASRSRSSSSIVEIPRRTPLSNTARARSGNRGTSLMTRRRSRSRRGDRTTASWWASMFSRLATASTRVLGVTSSADTASAASPVIAVTSSTKSRSLVPKWV